MIITDQQKEEAGLFYREALGVLHETGVDFLVGGAFALFHYANIFRDTKDLDIFCKSSDYPKILKHFDRLGYKTELTDARWLAKIFKDDYFIDIIFDSPNNICRVDESWFQHAVETVVHGMPVKLMAAEELIWCKIYVQNRERFDGADVNHILLGYGRQLDWNRLFRRLDKHWHLLLAQILIFQFIYPADYKEIIPSWLFEELMRRAHEQYELPPAFERVCLGPLIDQTQYETDIKAWNYKAYTIKTV